MDVGTVEYVVDENMGLLVISRDRECINKERYVVNTMSIEEAKSLTDYLISIYK